MGNSKSLPKYEELEDLYQEEEEEEEVVIDLLRKYIFDNILLVSMHNTDYNNIIENKINNLIILAKTYGLIIPVKKKNFTEFIQLTEVQKTEHNRTNLEIISSWVGRHWIDS
jgi:hypothetical protein